MAKQIKAYTDSGRVVDIDADRAQAFQDQGWIVPTLETQQRKSNVMGGNTGVGQPFTDAADEVRGKEFINSDPEALAAAQAAEQDARSVQMEAQSFLSDFANQGKTLAQHQAAIAQKQLMSKVMRASAGSNKPGAASAGVRALSENSEPLIGASAGLSADQKLQQHKTNLTALGQIRDLDMRQGAVDIEAAKRQAQFVADKEKLAQNFVSIGLDAADANRRAGLVAEGLKLRRQMGDMELQAMADGYNDQTFRGILQGAMGAGASGAGVAAQAYGNSNTSASITKNGIELPNPQFLEDVLGSDANLSLDEYLAKRG